VFNIIILSQNDEQIFFCLGYGDCCRLLFRQRSLGYR
jgi:hypothetical protein